ncbi:type II and III secretion system protein family protein [Desulfohalobium retbaense]|uniref:Type II and III secretion system protein n=1 Tax=Desulfohalobium retbaense (strain ATCC 49708 / DSM 5692 / JCM 16813 / HR100) TaxID=485915 RepID=C8X1N3_DESRD|nr:type II and III secretion system protein family protein [Desulfohalobium retbaense]ACV68455.1 type II and III secretion system protein [Desulfohalobium retbaense DSM 5692]
MATTPIPRSGLLIAAIMVLTFCVWSIPQEPQAQEFRIIPTKNSADDSIMRSLELTYGKSVVLKSNREITRVSEPDPNVLKDPLLIGPNELYLTPAGAGTANLILWQGKEVSTVYEITVKHDLSRLKQRLHELFPEENELRVLSTNESITLSGQVSSASALDQIMALAETYAPEGGIKNQVTVKGIHQVMLEVKVAEVSRQSLDRLGINFDLINDAAEFSIGFLGAASAGSSGSGSFNFWRNGDNVDFNGLFDFLKREGLAKILAEPSLISMSGQTSSFLAGGEIPIPDVDSDGNIGVEFKSYGIELAFTPTVMSKERIAIKVVPVVSELDEASGTVINGAQVPGLKVRRANTTVELGDGQSFAIAGLLSENSEETVSKFPGLGDLPVLGPLFTSKSFTSDETELVIMVTPKLVTPLVAEKQSLPTDFFIHPTDAEFYLGGLLGSLDGEFGHMVVK